MKCIVALKKVLRNLSAIQITAAYLVSSTSWFICSNLMLEVVPPTIHLIAHSLRDGLFILVSSVILYLVASHCRVSFHYSKKQLQQSQTRFQALYENMTQGVIYLSTDGHVISANPAAEQIIGMSLKDLTGLSLRSIEGRILSEDGTIFPWRDYPSILALRYGKPVKNVVMGIYNPQHQSHRWLKVDAVPQFGKDKDHPIEVFISLEDITDFRLAQQEIEQLAYYDTLTELPNRRLFMDRLSQTVNRAQRNNERLALLFLDLDDFKAVNDRFGHAGGDQLLCEVAIGLQQIVRKSDTVARLSGDEFVILLPAIHNDDDGVILAKKILHQFTVPVQIQQQATRIQTSIGIASYPADGSNAEQLLKCADLAMYRAKKQGKNNYCRYKAD
ncbi:MAG: diguanylate cyclase [Desulfuromonas sp.]|nr:diguanylate cyclase [Desulfuromonas sp.]